MPTIPPVHLYNSLHQRKIANLHLPARASSLPYSICLTKNGTGPCVLVCVRKRTGIRNRTEHNDQIIVNKRGWLVSANQRRLRLTTSEMDAPTCRCPAPTRRRRRLVTSSTPQPDSWTITSLGVLACYCNNKQVQRRTWEHAQVVGKIILIDLQKSGIGRSEPISFPADLTTTSS